MWSQRWPLLLVPVLSCLLWHSSAVADKGSGIELFRQGHFRQAVESLRQAREISPLDPDLQRVLAASCLGYGTQLLREDKLAEAAAILRQGRDLEPDNGQFSLYLGHILLRQGAMGEAENCLLESLRQLGPLPEIYHLLAKVCYGQGRLHEAQSYLEQVIELQPREEGSRNFLEKIQRELAIEEKMGSRHGGNFLISYVAGGEQLGADTLEVLRDAYAELGTLFNAFPEPAVTVILYGNRDFTTVTGAPDWAGGAYDGKIRVPVGGLQKMNAQLRRVLYHEYAHVLVFSLTRGTAPRWLDEGLAQIAEGEWPAEHLTALTQAAKGAAVIPLTRLERSFSGLSGAEAAAAYLQTQAFAHYLLDRYGWPRMLDLLQALGEGEKFSAAAARCLLYAGEDFSDIRQNWQLKEGFAEGS